MLLLLTSPTGRHGHPGKGLNVSLLQQALKGPHHHRHTGRLISCDGKTDSCHPEELMLREGAT